MLLSIWNYIRGYVIIKVTGFSVERFINLAVHKGIYIWDVEQQEDAVSMKLGIKAFKMLRECCQKTKCKVKIVGKVGIPFILFKYRRRKVLAVGVLIFVALLYLLSSFIWVIEVTGNERIETQAIESFLTEKELRKGVFKPGVNTKQLTNELLQNFSDISFASIEVKGTKAKINIVETIISSPKIDKSTPCDIVASKSGLILSVVTSLGTPLIKENDVVQKGDKLASGEIEIKNESEVTATRLVHAAAIVYAKIWYEITLSEKIDYIEKQYTGTKKKTYSIEAFGKSFFGNPKIDYEHFENIETMNQLKITEEFYLPITVTTTEHVEYIPVKKKYTEQELKKKLSKKLDLKIYEQLDNDTEVLDITSEYNLTKTELIMKSTVTTKERIDNEQMMVSY